MMRSMKKAVLFMLVTTLFTASISALAESKTAVVSGSDLNVYKDPTLTKFWGTVTVGTEVQINATKAGVSQITLNGKTGYCESSEIEEIKEDTPQKNITKTTQKARVYRSANIRSAYQTVPAGFELEVLEVSGSCAKVRKGKKIGYIYVGYLECYAVDTDDQQTKEYEESIEKIDSSGINSLKSMIASGKYSNEQIIFAFAIKSMGYNAAAAAGLLANLKAESAFVTTQIGDSGTSYGLCQWHASRKTRLINYCNENGFDYTTLEGQLNYLKYELEKFYPSVNKYMLSVSDDADGAYDAAYYFCYNFEGPANRVACSKTRATSAHDTYYPKYKEYIV